MQDTNSLINADELKAFDVVATKRNFSLAAAELHCSQSTVSQRIARLEQRLGHPLIRRTTRSVSLTPQGESMLIYARSILALNEDALLRLGNPGMAGIVKVGIEDEFATTRLPGVLGIFRAQFPNFGLSFVTGRNEHLHDALHAREVDIILGKSHGDGGGEVLWQEKLVWVGRPEALGKAGAPLSLLSYLAPSITRDIVESALLAARRVWVTTAEGSSLIGLIAAAEAGFGIMAIGQSFSTPALAQLPQEAGLPSLGSLDYTLQGRSAAPDPAVSAFSSVLRAAAKQVAGVPHT